MTLEELLEDFDGLPLLFQALRLEQEEQVDSEAEIRYMVVWKPTWVPLEELFECPFLIHDFWVQMRRH